MLSASKRDGASLRRRSFSDVVTLETIEHIADNQGFLGEITRVVVPDGYCVLSNPNRSYSERIKRVNPYHDREYSEQELLTLLKRYFSGVKLWYQGFAPECVERVRAYTAAIRERKASLPGIVRLVMNRVYCPTERYLSRRLPNHIIENLLRLRYPRPSTSEVIISPERMDEVIVYIAVCRGPLDVGRQPP